MATHRLFCLLLGLSAGSVFAWGGTGHRLIAESAERQLSPTARAEVNRLLALEPGATLASISTWADEHRSPSTARWHYVNLPRDAGCTYSAPRDCPEGACVVGAIERQAALLASTGPDAGRLQALRYLTHLVGDVHQPLHAAFTDDRGGNLYQVRFLGRGTNLHAVWDSGLLDAVGIEALNLKAPAPVDKAPGQGAGSPALWAEESCRVATGLGFYPAVHTLPPDYVQRMTPILVERLALASQRLAAVLNQAVELHLAQELAARRR
jgi:nuclease S1